jgi:hypothetical protein
VRWWIPALSRRSLIPRRRLPCGRSVVSARIGRCSTWATPGPAPPPHPVYESPQTPPCAVTPDRQWASIAAAGKRSDGLTHIEVIEHRSGTGWIVERLTGLIQKWSPYCVVIDAGSAAGAMIPALEAAGVTITRPTVREVAGAAGALFDATRPETLGVRHLGQIPLTRAVAGAVQRPLADAWMWNRRGSTLVISPLVAASLASWGLTAHGRPLQLFVTG